MTDIKLKDYSDIEDEYVELCYNLQEKIKKGESDIFIIRSHEGTETESRPTIFSEFNGGYWTQEYAGVVIDTEGNRFLIGSRFDKGDKQYFLQLMLEKTLGLKTKIFDKMKFSGDADTIFDLLLMMIFIAQLKTALRKGIFRQYRRFEYNDFKVHGAIDIARHMDLNPLENGKIASSAREYTALNSVNMLLLRAFDIMKHKYPNVVKNLLGQEHEVKKTLLSLAQTNPLYQTAKTSWLLKETGHKIVHPVYRSYEQLRQTSRLIIRRMGLNSFGSKGNKVMGILVDMAALWEDFLQEDIFKSLDAKPQKETSILGGNRTIRPDFFIEKPMRVVADAKYRLVWGNSLNKASWGDGTRDNVFQVLAYMLSLECNLGGVVFPFQGDKSKFGIETYSVYPDSNKRDKLFFTLPYYIPEYSDNDTYQTFSAQMREISQAVKEEFQNLISIT